MRRVDSHFHIIPPEYARELERRALSPIPLPFWSEELAYETMSRYAMDAAVLSPSPPGVSFGDQGLANELARMSNERTAEFVGSDPGRLAGLAILPLPDVDASLAELEHSLDALKLDGVALLTNVAGVYPGAKEWEPLFDELERRAAYVFVHPTWPHRGSPAPRYPDWLLEFPFETTRSVADLLYSGTLERCPNIRFQLAHLGGAVPFLSHRIASLTDRSPEFAAAVPDGPLPYLSRLYYDTGLSNNAPALAATLQIADVDHVVFGTDWPYAALPESGGDPAPGLAMLHADDRARVEAENVAALVPRFGGEDAR